MNTTLRGLAAAVAGVASLLPAWADTTATVALNWVKIGSAGSSVAVQSPTGAVLTTSAGVPLGPAGLTLGSNERQVYALTSDLYARGGTVVVTTGLSASAQAGSAGADSSANPPALPVIGAAFGSAGPFANYVLVKTVAAAPRNAIDVENTSGASIVLLRDDGTAAPGAAPVNASLIPLAAGAGAGQQGGSWTSSTFKGRLQVYAPSVAAFVSVFVD